MINSGMQNHRHLRKKTVLLFTALVLLLTACGRTGHSPQLPDDGNDQPTELNNDETNKEKTMKFFINDSEFTVDWYDNPSVQQIRSMAEEKDIVIQMSMYGGFEQVGSLGKRLTSSDSQTVTQCGDIVLYSSSQIVIFYGSNSWSYTRLGKISEDQHQALTDLLSKADVQLTITVQ